MGSAKCSKEGNGARVGRVGMGGESADIKCKEETFPPLNQRGESASLHCESSPKRMSKYALPEYV